MSITQWNPTSTGMIVHPLLGAPQAPGSLQGGCDAPANQASMKCGIRPEALLPDDMAAAGATPAGGIRRLALAGEDRGVRSSGSLAHGWPLTRCAWTISEIYGPWHPRRAESRS